jgi:CSLREA domain-containing protein
MTHFTTKALRILAILMTLIILMSYTQPAFASSFVVNSTLDEPDLVPGDYNCLTSSGVCTLRAAIMEANYYGGPIDTITFNISGAVPVDRKITINTELPAITTQTTIQGPNILDGARIVLDGNGGNYNGLIISYNNCVVRALGIRNFGKNGIYVNGTSMITGTTIAGSTLGTTTSMLSGNGMNGIYLKNAGSSVIGGDNASDRNIISRNTGSGIYIEDGGTNVVRGNYIGTDAAGTVDHGNGGSGIEIDESEGNTIGGSTSARRNIISGNDRFGVEIMADQNYVQGNYIGTDSSGTLAIPNQQFGVAVISYSDTIFYDNQIGGTVPGEGNLISGNGGAGVHLQNANATLIQGNVIGLNATQTAALPNSTGITFASGSDNFIGGTAIGAGNVIAGNTTQGISVSNNSTTNNKIQQNRIGVNASGAAMPNEGSGVAISNATNITVGGTETRAGNIIAYNSGDGVTMYAFANFNKVVGNAIYGNTGLGINLSVHTDPVSGVTPNDTNDVDALGPNDLQNYPILTKVTFTSSTSVTIQGSLNSQANSNFTIHFYGNDTCDPSMYGEGQVYLGSTSITTNSSHNATFSKVLSVTQIYLFITATATDVEGKTSEFSACRSASTIYLPLILK